MKRVCGGDDEGVVVLERLDEPTGETGGNHDHLPLDAAVGEHARERARRELVELERRKVEGEPVVATAVRGDVEQDDVLLGVDGVAEVGERGPQGCLPWRWAARSAMRGCSRNDRPPGGVEALVEQLRWRRPPK
jgi:hypothetical protein